MSCGAAALFLDDEGVQWNSPERMKWSWCQVLETLAAKHLACSLEFSLHLKTRRVSLGKAGASWALEIWEASVQLSSMAGSGV